MRTIAILLALASTAHADGVRYSLPWQLRPVTIDNVVRADTAAAAFNDDNGNVDIASTSAIGASYQIAPRWAATMRLAFVGNNAPGSALDGSSLGNPVLGATYARTSGRYRYALSFATTIPVGTGGGNDPDPRAARTNLAAMTARPADDVMFDVNYLTESVGGDIAYVNRGFTAQAELTLREAIRVRGSSSTAATDASRTSAVLGVHLGYFIGSHVSLSSDVRVRRWLSHPTRIDAMSGVEAPIPDGTMNMLTVAVGPRVHFQIAKGVWIRPGVSITRGVDSRGLDAPLLTPRTTAVQIDIPVVF